MAEPNPRTWADGDALSQGNLNDEIRDPLQWALGHSSNPKPHCILKNNAPQALTSGSFTALTFQTEVVDRGGMHAANSTDVVITVDGIYHCSGWVEVESAACNKDVAIYLNGTDIIAEANQYGVGTPAVGRLAVDGYVSCVATDVITLEVFQDLGSSINADPYQLAVVYVATAN